MVFYPLLIFSQWFFCPIFVVDGAWCVSVVALPSSNVTVRWRRKRYRSSSAFLHHRLLRCYSLLAQLRFSFNNWLNRWAWLTATSSGLQQKRQRWIAVYYVGGRAAICMTAWCYGFIRDCSFERHWGHHKRPFPAVALVTSWTSTLCPQHGQTSSLGGCAAGVSLESLQGPWALSCHYVAKLPVSMAEGHLNFLFQQIWCVFLRLLSCHREGIILMLLCYGMPRKGNRLSSRTPLSVGPC